MPRWCLGSLLPLLLLMCLCCAQVLLAGNVPPAGGGPAGGGPPRPAGAGGVPPPPSVQESGGHFVDFKVSVFPPYQSSGTVPADTTESLPELAQGRAYCRRGYYLPLVVNFFNQSNPPEEFDTVIQVEVNGLTFDPQRAQREGASRIDYYTEMHVGVGAPAEQTFSVLIPSDQSNDPLPTLTVYIRPKGGIKGYDRTIFLDDIDRPDMSHPGTRGSKLVLAISADPSQAPPFQRCESYLKARNQGAANSSGANTNYENVIFVRPRKGFMVKYVPADWYALSMINMMLIDKSPQNMTWTAENQKTIVEWVRAGGVLVLAGPPDRKQWEKLGLDTLAGVKVIEEPPHAVTDVGGLMEAFPGGKSNDEQFVNADRPLQVGHIRKLDANAFSIDDAAGLPLYQERRVGAGLVVVIPWDIEGVNSGKAVSNEDWGRRDMIYEHLWQYIERPALGPFASVNQVSEVDEKVDDASYAMWRSLKPINETLPVEQRQQESKFAEDLDHRRLNRPSHWSVDQWLFRNYLKNSFEKQSPIKLPATRVVAGFLLLYLFLVSPFTYLVMRMLRRLEWAWPVSILLAFLFALFSYGYFYAGNQGTMICNEVSVVELTDGDPHGVAQSWLALYSPSRGFYQINFPDTPYAETAAYPLGTERAVSSLMLYDRGINLTLASDSGTGVNVTWDKLEPIMKEVYINDRSSQYFSTTNLVDFGAATGGMISYSISRVSGSSRGYIVKVSNTTQFPILAPSLAINDFRYPLVLLHAQPGDDFKSTFIPAGAKDLELRTETEDLSAPSRQEPAMLGNHLRQQVPREWEQSEFLNDRCVYLNALSTIGRENWKRGPDLDTRLVGWINAPSVFVAVDGTPLTQQAQYTGVMQVVVRKPGNENAQLADAYRVNREVIFSFRDDGHDPRQPWDATTPSEPMPALKRDKYEMTASQVGRYGGLLEYTFKRSKPPLAATQALEFRLPILSVSGVEGDTHAIKVKSVVFNNGGAASKPIFQVPDADCVIRVEIPRVAPQLVKEYNLANKTPGTKLYLQFTVNATDLQKLAVNESYPFQMEVQVRNEPDVDEAVAVDLGHFSVVEK